MDYGEMHFEEAPKIIVDPPGPKAKKLLEEQRNYESNAVLYPLSLPFVPYEAKGATVKDVDGNIYLDFFAGISVLNVGHSNPYVLKALSGQAEKLIHTLDFPTHARVKLARKLFEIAPGKLKGNCKVLFGGPTGSDAVEGAVKLVKHHTGRNLIVAFEGSYHGQTSMSLALSSTVKYKEEFVPLAPEAHFLPYAYCYRCAFNLSYPECGLYCAQNLERILNDPYSGLTKPAAVIIEPIQGEGGIIVPPEGYLQRIREICSENNVLLIVDEIQAGMGRTGKMFACEHWNVTPDIVTFAKAVGGIGLPLAGILFKRELDTWGPGSHVGTFRGNVAAMAAGLASIEFMEKNKVLSHVDKMGEKIIKRLNELSEETDKIGEVRGKGLMIGVEFVKERDSKEPDEETVKKIQLECFKRGLIVWKAGHFSNIIRFLPPLIVTEEQIERAMEIFCEVTLSHTTK